jgi:hypothetical protein
MKIFSNHRLIQNALVLLCMAQPEFAISGSHYEEKDEFDGSKFTAFRATKAERLKSDLEYILLDYKPQDETFLLNVGTETALVNCGELGLEIRTSMGVIHKINATEHKLQYCNATVKLEWVRKSFSVRVPMRSVANRIGVMDTTTLKPERYIIK